MLLVGADIGGTFTDIVLLSDAGGLTVEKRLSTVEDYSIAIVEGLARLIEEGGGDARDIVTLAHGTTVATNAVLEREGARTALVGTEGFRDILEIGRLRTPRLYDIGWTKPRPLVPRRLRFEVPERIAADGSVVRALDLELTLIPRKIVPAVRSIVRSSTRGTVQDGEVVRPAYSLDENDDG